MAVSMVLMLERLEKRSGVTPAAFPPPIFAGTTSVSLFHVSPPPPLRNVKGVFLLVFLGQAERQEMKMDGTGGSRPKRS
jgi:hypothetical protein